MAIFKDTPEKDKSEPRNGTTGEGALSIIAAGMTVTGDIDSNGVVKVEGRVEGTIRAARQVLIGRQGTVKGDVFTRDAVVGGTVQGNLSISERLEIQTTASVTGDVTTKTLVIQEGGRIDGGVHMSDVAAGASAPSLVARSETKAPATTA